MYAAEYYIIFNVSKSKCVYVAPYSHKSGIYGLNPIFLLVGRILNMSINGRIWDTFLLQILTIVMILCIVAMVCLARSIMFYVSSLRGIRL
jgi:hypothetical protein